MVKGIERSPYRTALPSTSPGGSVRVGRRRLELEQVTPSAWRVCDARFPPGHPRRLLGCIDQHPDAFELMQLDSGFHWSFFASIRDALEHIAETMRTPSRQSSATGPGGLSGAQFW